MAIEVPTAVQDLFLVLTGEKWPTANEDRLREVGNTWGSAGDQLRDDLGPLLVKAVHNIRDNFTGKAAIKFADMMAPYVVDPPQYIPQAAAQFQQLKKFLLDAATQVEYVKIISIEELILLIAQIAWAIANAFWTDGASMTWLAARMAIVRFLLKTLWGRLILQFVIAEIFGIAFQLALDVLTQAIQFAKGTRDSWDVKATIGAVEVGAVGGLLSLPFSSVSHFLSHKLTSGLTKILGRDISVTTLQPVVVRAVNGAARNLGANTPISKVAKEVTENLFRAADKPLRVRLAQIGVPAIIEMVEEGLHEAITEGTVMAMNGQGFTFNPYSFTSGVASSIASQVGHGIGKSLAAPTPTRLGYVELGDGSVDGTDEGDERRPLLAGENSGTSDAGSFDDGASLAGRSDDGPTTVARSPASPASSPPPVPPKDTDPRTGQNGIPSRTATSSTPGRPSTSGAGGPNPRSTTTPPSTTSSSAPSYGKASSSTGEGSPATRSSTETPSSSRRDDQGGRKTTPSRNRLREDSRSATTPPATGERQVTTDDTSTVEATAGANRNTGSRDGRRTATGTGGPSRSETRPPGEDRTTRDRGTNEGTTGDRSGNGRSPRRQADPSRTRTEESTRAVRSSEGTAHIEPVGRVIDDTAIVPATRLASLEAEHMPPVNRLVVEAADGEVLPANEVQAAADRIGVEVVARVDRAQIGNGRRRGVQWMSFSANGGRPRPVHVPVPSLPARESTSARARTEATDLAPMVSVETERPGGQSSAGVTHTVTFREGQKVIDPDQLEALRRYVDGVIERAKTARDEGRPIDELRITGYGHGWTLARWRNERARQTGVTRAAAVREAVHRRVSELLDVDEDRNPRKLSRSRLRADDFLIQDSSGGRDPGVENLRTAQVTEDEGGVHTTVGNVHTTIGGRLSDAASVPKVLHFIWFGTKPIGAAVRQNLSEWATRADAAGYRMHLWVDDDARNTNGDFLDSLTEGATYVEISDVGVLQRPDLVQPDVDVTEELTLALRHGIYNMASDLARYAILQREDGGGGIYIDVDIAPGEVDLHRLDLRLDPDGIPFLAPEIRDTKRLSELRDDLKEVFSEKYGSSEPSDIPVKDVVKWQYDNGNLNNNLIVAPRGSTFMGDLIRRIKNPGRGESLLQKLKKPGMRSDDLKRNAAALTGPDLVGKVIESRIKTYIEDHVPTRTAGSVKVLVEFRAGRAQVAPAMRDQWAGLGWVTGASDEQIDRSTSPTDGATSGPPPSPLTVERPDGGPATSSLTAGSEDSHTDPLMRLLAQAPGVPLSHTWFDPASYRPVKSAFDVRRVEHDGERVTELSVAVRLDREAGVSEAELQDTWQRVTDGVEEFFNEPQHRFGHGDVNGDLFRVKVVRAEAGQAAHLVTTVVPYTPGREMTQRTWVVGQRPVFYAHEIAHQLGARDESRQTSRDFQMGQTTRTISRTARNAGSLMGDFNAAAEGGPQAGLRSRHLDLFATLIGHVTPFTGQETHHGGNSGPSSSDGGKRRLGGQPDARAEETDPAPTAPVETEPPGTRPGSPSSTAVPVDTSRSDPSGSHPARTESDRRNREVDGHLVAAVNAELARYGERWTDGAADAAQVRRALAELPQGGPTDFKGLASDIAGQLALGAPPRMRAGAVGFEAEVRPIVQLRSGVHLRTKDFQVTARDGSFSAVLDNTFYYIATDDSVYGSESALRRDGKNLRERVHQRVLEFVTVPIHTVPGDVGRADAGTVLAAVERAIGRLAQLSGGRPIEEIFPEEEFDLSGDAQGAVVWPDPAGRPFDLLVHFTAGVPIARMHEFLSDVRDHSSSRSAAREHLADALNFANEIAAGYVRTLPGFAGHRIPPYAMDLLQGREDVSALRGFLALVYAQVGPIMHGQPHETVALKVRAAAASRTSLAGVRETLPDPVLSYLTHQSEHIRDELVNTAGRRRDVGPDPLSVEGLDERWGHTIGDYLNTALLPDQPEISQDEALGVDTHFRDPDTNDGHQYPPLALVELRSFGPQQNGRHTMVGLRDRFETVQRLAQIADHFARVVETTSRTETRRRQAATVPAELDMFRGTPPQWVQEIDSFVNTAWYLDPVLQGMENETAVVTEQRVDRIVRATSAVLRGDHAPSRGLVNELEELIAALRGVATRHPITRQVADHTIATAGRALRHLRARMSGPSTAPAHPADATGEPKVSNELLVAINHQLDLLGPGWTGGRVDAARVNQVLAALFRGGWRGARNPAADIARLIAAVEQSISDRAYQMLTDPGRSDRNA